MSGIEITQADREALERFIREDAPLGMKKMFGGDPAYKLAEAFARHRHEARAEALAEAAEMAMLERVEGVEGTRKMPPITLALGMLPPLSSQLVE
ncbi:hypothetical protein [Novosphingobium lindaniclasticum]